VIKNYGKYRNLCLLVIFLLTGTGNAVKAQNEPDRPMRQIQQNQMLNIDNSSLVNENSSIFIPNLSLLNTSSLEQTLTQYYITQYSSRGGIEYLNTVLARGSLYMPYILMETARRNLPVELAYLPIVESGFQITARSRSGAVGLWQFMMNSIAPFDLKVNDFIDERKDYQKSTRGALQKLEDNYRVLGDWELALAAYNCGLGALTRTVQKTKIRDYWALCSKNELKKETTHYVPKLLAVAYILSQPRRFGIDYWPQNHEITAIPLERQVSLDILAAEAGVDRQLLRRLNPELLNGISPADKNYRLKIPAAHLQAISIVLEREDLKLISYHYHIVRHGDTLWSMSRHYGASINLIEQHNPGISGRYLKIGETVIIPAFTDVKPPARPILTRQLTENHIVQKGETLWSLGIKYGIDPQVLAEENGMELNQILREGRTLKVPILE